MCTAKPKVNNCCHSSQSQWRDGEFIEFSLTPGLNPSRIFWNAEVTEGEADSSVVQPAPSNAPVLLKVYLLYL